MKKNIMIVCTLAAALLLMTACGGDGSENTDPKESETSSYAAESTEESTEAPADIENEKPVSIYYMNYSTSQAELITEWNAEWSTSEDLGVFGAFNSTDAVIGFDSEKEAHLEYWDAVETGTEYKIGYELEFTLGTETVVITILDPADVEDSEYLFMGDVDNDEVTGYLGVWLYDDVNQDGGFYSHITSAEVTEDTLLTSVKLRPVEGSSQISNLKLTAFSYSSDLEFDDDGHYNGAYGYTVTFNPEN